MTELDQKENCHRLRHGFSLIELLIVISIISLLASIVLFSGLFARKKSRDTKRQADLYQIARFLTLACHTPDDGKKELDLVELAGELVIKYPQYNQYLTSIPKDPLSGTDMVAGYRYIVSVDGSQCAIFANLENESATITLPNITSPTPGGGQGVFKGTAFGVNNTDIYYQYSN